MQLQSLCLDLPYRKRVTPFEVAAALLTGALANQRPANFHKAAPGMPFFSRNGILASPDTKCLRCCLFHVRIHSRPHDAAGLPLHHARTILTLLSVWSEKSLDEPEDNSCCLSSTSIKQLSRVQHLCRPLPFFVA